MRFNSLLAAKGSTDEWQNRKLMMRKMREMKSMLRRVNELFESEIKKVFSSSFDAGNKRKRFERSSFIYQHEFEISAPQIWSPFDRTLEDVIKVNLTLLCYGVKCCVMIVEKAKFRVNLSTMACCYACLGLDRVHRRVVCVVCVVLFFQQAFSRQFSRAIDPHSTHDGEWMILFP